uniref:Uncharacterized protein n=1 Tax=Cacopsylla melanoneura TaxID=428564 RepID=A0A8D8ZMQ7_9HEMI
MILWQSYLKSSPVAPQAARNVNEDPSFIMTSETDTLQSSLVNRVSRARVGRRRKRRPNTCRIVRTRKPEREELTHPPPHTRQEMEGKMLFLHSDRGSNC